MLNEKEQDFLQYWESVRDAESGFSRKLLSGLPFAMLFFFPVPTLLLVVYMFMPEWYAKVSDKVPGAIITILIALALGIFFLAYFRMHFRWETNENYYRTLKARLSQASTNVERIES